MRASQTDPGLISLLRADLARLGNPARPAAGFRLWIKLIHPRFMPVLLLRMSWACHRHVLTRPLGTVFSLLNVILFGLEVTPRCQIGPGLFLPHTSGTVIGAIEIGSGATIFQGVTLGAKFADLEFTPNSRPVIGDEVVVGAGAKVLGGIKVGNRAIVAANSLVLDNVADGALMIGVPAIEKRAR